MAENIQEWQNETKAFIENYVAQNGKIRAKAFPGRAAILVKMLELDERHISAVYEISGSIKFPKPFFFNCLFIKLYVN